MKKFLGIILLVITVRPCFGQQLTYTLVALCDNDYQGIVPVPKSIGNGDDPKNNLYWGCGYGVKTFFAKKSMDWELISTQKVDSIILERCVFYNAKKGSYHIADAYRGRNIKECNIDFFKAASGKLDRELLKGKLNAKDAKLVNYVGHNGLMDFKLTNYPRGEDDNKRKVCILGCYSSQYYKQGLKVTKATPYIWTTHLMAPEAYTLEKIINAFFSGESGKVADEAAAQVYNKYQKCGIKGARNLFKTGW